MEKNSRLHLKTGNALYVIDLDQLVCVTADDHYSSISYRNGTDMLVPFGISEIERELDKLCLPDGQFIRACRKYIVNMKFAFYINLSKQQLTLYCDNGGRKILTVPKDRLRLIYSSFLS